MTPRRLSLPACARHPVESSLAGWLLILWSVRQIAEQEAFGKAIGMDLFNFMESFNHGVVSNGLPAGCGILSRCSSPSSPVCLCSAVLFCRGYAGKSVVLRPPGCVFLS